MQTTLEKDLTKLTNEELITLARGGDEDAKEQLFIKNQPFVYKMARKYRFMDDFEDLVSIGNIALSEAYLIYDETKDIKFITYYSKCIYTAYQKHYNKIKKLKSNSSLNKNIADEDNLSAIDLVVDNCAEKPFALLEDRIVLNKVLDKFYSNESDKHINILNLRYIKGMSQHQVAMELDTHSQTIRNNEKKIKSSLQFYMNLQQ